METYVVLMPVEIPASRQICEIIEGVNLPNKFYIDKQIIDIIKDSFCNDFNIDEDGNEQQCYILTIREFVTQVNNEDLNLLDYFISYIYVN